jgi:hypothetical protein
MAKDALTNGSMLLRSDMNIRVFAWCQIRDSVTPA